MFVPVDPPTQRSSLWVHHRMAAIDAASGTAIIRSISDGMKLGLCPLQPGTIIQLSLYHRHQITGGRPARAMRQIVCQRIGRRSPQGSVSPIRYPRSVSISAVRDRRRSADTPAHTNT
jgi:hypothetical protein